MADRTPVERRKLKMVLKTTHFADDLLESLKQRAAGQGQNHADQLDRRSEGYLQWGLEGRSEVVDVSTTSGYIV